MVILLPRNTRIGDDLGPLHDVATLMGSDSPQLAIIKERDREQAGVGWPQALWNILITAETSWAETRLAPQTVRDNCAVRLSAGSPRINVKQVEKVKDEKPQS